MSNDETIQLGQQSKLIGAIWNNWIATDGAVLAMTRHGYITNRKSNLVYGNGPRGGTQTIYFGFIHPLVPDTAGGKIMSVRP